MLLIQNTLVSLDIFEQRFVCDLGKCRGHCCVEGVAGAPLDNFEKPILEEVVPKVKSFMRPEGLKAIEEQGVTTTDTDGDFVTPLVHYEECAYAVFENGIAKCAIENAYFKNVVDFRKPISCHLYPIRISYVNGMEALNYHEWEICRPAVNKGKVEGVPVYKFVKDALIRRYGEAWYNELEEAAEAYYEKQKIR
jgi:hypothetical protein